mmetsp:Transcript_36722/g.85287  ORF Transcript_36722/g.85287 Transcript_36722/m.85287 type:complete len:304 (-) Transcript_36722:26-937(-)|eukprot:CAMPEP_0176269258 /NCGR_PEP_ID=MMETSP0121_2-20121125/44100_1 /TAXON_ID=160619 /ORGANISM="Kryptoperidinium foliaceum, Strain CCMP 1326" /LENGTH=303 /DNA_ID=CAMNT_0017609383 /DNA_START=55 /DNA_END=966 /DNA_ORIENTATION=+
MASAAPFLDFIADPMLKSALPHALAPTGGEPRHSFQEKVIASARDALAESRTNLEAAQRDAEAKMEKAREEAAECEAAVSAASAKLEKAKAEVAPCATRLEELRSVAADEKRRFREIEQATAAAISFRDELEAARARAAAAAAALEAGDADVVVRVLEARRADKALLAAVPCALRVPVESRQEFDRFTVSEAADVISKMTAEVEAEFAASFREAEYAEAERLGAWALMDVAALAASAQQAALTDAEAAVRDAEVGLKVAKVTLAGRRGAYVGAQEECEQLKVKGDHLTAAEEAFAAATAAEAV